MNLLLFEYLHANPDWFRDASPSLRAEGRAMLEAVAADLAALNITTSVPLCAQARTSVNLPLPHFEVSASSIAGFADQTLADNEFTHVLPIAPESDAALLSLVRVFREHSCRVLAMPTNQTEVFCDKWLTHQYLTDNNLPALPTVPAQDFHTLALPETASCVIKPRDGAGCENVRIIERSRLERTVQGGSISSATHIVQPLMRGRSLSAGFLGQGRDGNARILPPADQNIIWRNGQPTYTGGTIRPSLSPAVESSLQQLCEKIAACLGGVSGYYGVDFLLPDNSEQPLVMEVNPRLCSSYIGYQQATMANLMAVMLGNKTWPVEWTSEPATFRCS